jgi:RecA/RadA recombinase
MMERIHTGCKALDLLSDGGLATGTITQVFGEKALGKSLISLQAAFSAVANGNSAIILDTEQSYFSYLLEGGHWDSKLAKRFGKDIKILNAQLERGPKSSDKRTKAASRSQLITALGSTLNQLKIAYTNTHLGVIADVVSPEFHFGLDVNEPAVIVIQMPEVEPLLGIHGIEAGKVVSEGGRVEMRLRSTPVYQSPLNQLIHDTTAKLLVYDSISAPLKASFPTTQDLPARSASLAMMLSHAQRLCVDYGISVLTTSHVSIDPIHGWNRRPYGGVMLGHEAKFSFELTYNDSKRNQEATAINPEGEEGASRAFWIARHPAFAEYDRFGYAKIDDGGFS